MQSGKLDTPLEVQQPTEVADDYNQLKITGWTKYVDLMGERITKQVNEQDEAEQLVAIQIVIWRVRYCSGITEKMRLKEGSNYYNILGIEPLGRDRFLLIRTKKRDNEN